MSNERTLAYPSSKSFLVDDIKRVCHHFGATLILEEITSTFVKNYVGDSTKKFQAGFRWRESNPHYKKKDRCAIFYGAFTNRENAAIFCLRKLMKCKRLSDLHKT